MERVLAGKVAVVTGASRGAGRGIAAVLGEAGATVYVTGRSSRTIGTTQNRRETIEETADMVTDRGGRGIPVRCDHTVAADVAALFDRVKAESGRLDLLVNNAWGGYQTDMDKFGWPFWKQPDRWEAMFEAGVRPHLTASRYAVPLMLPSQSGLIINTTFYDGGMYLSNLYYDVAKAAVNRMAYGMGLELKKHGIAAVALSPGWMRTERTTDDPLPDNIYPLTESPEYLGRAVLHLAADPEILSKTGQTLLVADLAKEYGFTDTDGRLVPAFHV